MTHLRNLFVVGTCMIVTLGGCRLKQDETNDEPVTTGEAIQALEEVGMSAQATNLTSASIEIATSFTIGGAVEAAAEEIHDFIQTQLPCAEVTLMNNTVEVEYGVNGGNCVYRGHTYSGSHSITVSGNDMGDVEVQHVWDEMANGAISVSGEANVTWSFQDETRHVVHELTWTRLRDNRVGIGRGDRLQRALPGGIVEGFQVDGDRSWEGDAGTWDLDIDGVQMRWADPVPQAGSYTLTTPKNKSASLSFDRKDEDTITVTLESGDKSFSFDVTRAGAITES